MSQTSENADLHQAFLPNLKEKPEERLQRLIAEHKGNLASSFEELLGDGGMPDETADDIIKAVREWRNVPTERKLD